MIAIVYHNRRETTGFLGWMLCWWSFCDNKITDETHKLDLRTYLRCIGVRVCGLSVERIFKDDTGN